MVDLLVATGRTATRPYPSFAAAAVGALELLHALSDLDLLLVTRVDLAADTQHVVAALDGGTLTVLPPRVWSGSACQHMVRGDAPAVAPRLAEVANYADAPNLHDSGLSCYIGVPLARGGEGLFGSVCGFGLEPRSAGMHALLPAFQQVARLLGTQLSLVDDAEERYAEAVAQSERLLAAALIDPVTGLANRTGLEQALTREESRLQRNGQVAAALVLDVDGLKQVNDTEGHHAGDELLRRVADGLRATSRASDVLGRSGGDEFLLLLPGETRDSPAVRRVLAALADSGLPVSTGVADTDEVSDLTGVRALADERLYADKLRRRGSSPPR